MTKVLRELAARRTSRQDWMTKPRRNFIDQFYEDLALIGLGGIDFEEAVALMKRPKEWEKTVDQICAAYPRPAPVLPKAPQKKAVPPETGEFATPARKKRPYHNRKDRFLRKVAKSLGNGAVPRARVGRSPFSRVMGETARSKRLHYF